MEHEFYFDGSPQRICWAIKTNEDTVERFRDHAEVYFEKVNSEQSKYIALHVGIFWGIGTFIIKDNDTVKIMIDSKSIYDNMMRYTLVQDELSRGKIKFIFQLINQRGLKTKFTLISNEDNLSTHML